MRAQIFFSTIAFWCIIQVNFSQNLVPNGDMETVSSCPINSDYYVDNATNWQSLSGHGGTADYFHSCGDPQHDWTNFSDNNSVSPHSGSGYIGMSTYSDFDQREYAEIQLSSPLVAGETYEVAAWVYGARGDYASTAYADNIGIYVTATNPSVSGCGMCVGVYGVTPQVSSSFVVTNTWVQISATFVASGGEQYLVLGNFSNNASTNAVANGAPTMGGISAYTFFDDVSVTLSNPLPATVSGFDVECTSKGATTRWVSGVENNLCEYRIQGAYDAQNWNDITSVIPLGGIESGSYYQEDIAQDNLYPYYRIAMIDCDGSTEYTEIRHADCGGEHQIQVLQVDNNVTIQGLLPEKPHLITVYSTCGQLIQRQMVSTSGCQLRGLSAGCYIVVVQDMKEEVMILQSKLLIP